MTSNPITGILRTIARNTFGDAMAAKTKKSPSAVPRIVVIAGNEPYLMRRQIDSLLDRLLPPEQRPMSLYHPRAQDVQLSDILDELRTAPFLADRRVVLLEDADSFVSENRERLESYFDSPSSCGVLILGVKKWPSNTILARKLTAVGSCIKIEGLQRAQLASFAVSAAKDEFGKILSSSVAQRLVEWIGDDAGHLHSEIEKLAIYVGNRSNISDKDVESLVGHSRLFEAFAVIDEVTAGRLSHAIDKLRQMFAADKSTEYTVVGAFAWHIRRLISVRSLREKGISDESIARQLRIFHGRDSLFRQADRMDMRFLGGMICELARLDYASKTGQAEIPTAMEKLVLRLSEDLKPA